MIGREEEAGYFLKNGEFEKAKSIFSLLLDKTPDHPDWIAGYFLSSYWDNKLDHLLSLREGKDRGKSILRYLDDFEWEMSKRGYPRNWTYESAISCVLEEASHHFGIAFRLEGWNGMDTETIRGLAVCHIRLKNFGRAMEILEYGPREIQTLTEFHFLRAECLVGMNRIEEGKDLYGRAFLDDPTKLRPEWVIWKDLRNLVDRLQEKRVESETLPHLIPALLLQQGSLTTSLPGNARDLGIWSHHLLQLHETKSKTRDKFLTKLNLRLYYVAGIIVHRFPEKTYPQESGGAKRIFDEARSEISDLLLL